MEAETYKGKRKTQRHGDNTLEIQMHIETRAVRERESEKQRDRDRDKERKGKSDTNTQWIAVFNGKKPYKLPEKDCILALWASWEEGFFGLPEVLDSPKSLCFPH